MNKDDFNRFSESNFSHIPVYKELVADLISPLYVYSNFYELENTFLFESAKTHETKGRYSIMSLPAVKRYDFYEDELEIKSKEKSSVQRVIDPFDYIEKLTKDYSAPKIKDLPNFLGGLVGYFTYESFKFVEPKLHFQQSKIPLISLFQCDEIIVFDNFKGTFYIVVNTTDKTEHGYIQANKRIEEIERAIFSLQPSVSQNFKKSIDAIPSESNVNKKEFLKQVDVLKENIISGEIMQAVLSREETFNGYFDPFTLYRSLRLINPSPYMYFLNFGKFRVIGSSPEILVQDINDQVIIRPIAGTRKRGSSIEEDLSNKIELLEDEKEKSEHMMLVDLARNDLSKVCEPGSVQVDEMMIVEKYSHVMHMTSNVIGRKIENKTQVDCLKAAIPAGTLSGAPKIRAMELLSELEGRPRGIYGGAVGYLGYNGSLDTAIVIRTAIHYKDCVQVGIGAGIVHDSVPENEWNETEAKLAVFREVLKYK